MRGVGAEPEITFCPVPRMPIQFLQWRIQRKSASTRGRREDLPMTPVTCICVAIASGPSTMRPIQLTGLDDLLPLSSTRDEALSPVCRG